MKSATFNPGILPETLQPEQRLKFPQLATLTGLGCTKIYADIAAGRFPAPERDGRRCSRCARVPRCETQRWEAIMKAQKGSACSPVERMQAPGVEHLLRSFNGANHSETQLFAQMVIARSELRRRLLLRFAQDILPGMRVPIEDPDNIALIGCGPHFEPVLKEMGMAYCFAELSPGSNYAPLNDLAEFLRDEELRS